MNTSKKSSHEPDQEAERQNDKLFIESLILAQDERWRDAEHMQVEREDQLRTFGGISDWKVANG